MKDWSFAPNVNQRTLKRTASVGIVVGVLTVMLRLAPNPSFSFYDFSGVR